MTKFYARVDNAEGAGSGTTFNEEFQMIIDIREGRVDRDIELFKEKKLEKKVEKIIKRPESLKRIHNAPIICLSDAEIDTVYTKYEWPIGSNKIIKGRIPPNTYMMCFENGIKYMKREGYFEDERPGYLSFSKNIQYYNLSKENRFGK